MISELCTYTNKYKDIYMYTCTYLNGRVTVLSEAAMQSRMVHEPEMNIGIYRELFFLSDFSNKEAQRRSVKQYIR